MKKHQFILICLIYSALTVPALAAEDRAAMLMEGGIASFQARDFAKAELQFKSSLQLAEHANDQEQIHACWYNLALVQNATAQYSSAELSLKKLLGLTQLPEGVSHFDVISQLAVVYVKEGKLSLAEQLDNETLNSAKVKGDPLLAAKLHLDLASIAERQVKPDETLKQFSQASELLNQSTDPRRDVLRSRLLNNLGVLYLKSHKLDEAEKTTREALALTTKLYGDNYRQTAIALTNVAAVLKERNKLDEALQLYQKASDINSKQGVRDLVSQNNIAGIHITQRKFSQAEKELLILENLSNKSSDFGSYVQALTNLATCYAKEGKKPSSQETFAKALKVAQQHDDKEILFRVKAAQSECFPPEPRH